MMRICVRRLWMQWRPNAPSRTKDTPEVRKDKKLAAEWTVDSQRQKRAAIRSSAGSCRISKYFRVVVTNDSNWCSKTNFVKPAKRHWTGSSRVSKTPTRSLPSGSRAIKRAREGADQPFQPVGHTGTDRNAPGMPPSVAGNRGRCFGDVAAQDAWERAFRMAPRRGRCRADCVASQPACVSHAEWSGDCQGSWIRTVLPKPSSGSSRSSSH